MTTLENILGTVESGISTAQEIVDITSGMTPAIATKFALAEADPTSANVQAVLAAYTSAGQVPPAKLVAHLLLINEQRHPEDTVRGNVAPYVLGAAALLIWVFSRRKK